MTSSAECADHIIRVLPLILRELWNRLQAESPVSVTFSQLALLSLIHQEPLTMADVADRWGVSSPTMSKMVSLLVDRGWVVREEDPRDRRRKLLSFTPEGWEAHSRAYEAVQESVAGSLDVLDDDQRARIVEALDLLMSSIR